MSLKDRELALLSRALCGVLAMASLALAQDRSPEVLPLPAAVRFTAPHAEGEGPTEVRVGFYLIDVLSINDVEESFSADFALILKWRDPRLSDPALGLVGTQVPLGSVWSPSIHVVNDKSLRLAWPRILQIEADGAITYRQRYQGEVSSRLDLRRFPMDVQELAVELMVLGHTEDEVRLVPDADWSGSRDAISPAGWRVELGEAETVTEVFAAQNRRISRLNQHLLARRDSSYYLYKVFLPFTLIVFMAWTVFWIDPSNVGPQFAIATSSVFTLIAFQLGLNSSLPKIAYLTRADQFNLGCTVLVFGALGEAVVAAKLARKGKEDLALRIDRVARVVYPVAFLGLAFFTLWVA